MSTSHLNFIPVHVEVLIKSTTTRSKDEIESLTLSYLKSNVPVFKEGLLKISNLVDGNEDNRTNIQEYVESIRISLPSGSDKSVSFWQAKLFVHAFRLSDQEPDKAE